jgi:ABC-type dipeptide/oligopeptide/nickel transport system permease component
MRAQSPRAVQYHAVGKNVFTGELGESFNYVMPVSTLYFQRLPNSLESALAGTLISFFVGIPAAIISAVKVNSGWDRFGKVVAFLGAGHPWLLA